MYFSLSLKLEKPCAVGGLLAMIVFENVTADVDSEASTISATKVSSMARPQFFDPSSSTLSYT